MATDPNPLNYAREMLGNEDAPHFAVERLDGTAAIARYAPRVVLCAFMCVGEDWTPAWREAGGVGTYVLIGTLGFGPRSYVALNRVPSPDGYERLLLREVSSHMLDASDEGAEAATGAAHLCAVAFVQTGT